MIFEKNPFTTAVSIPKSFHLAIEALYSEKIDQPFIIIGLVYRIEYRVSSYFTPTHNNKTPDDSKVVTNSTPTPMSGLIYCHLRKSNHH